MRKWQGTFEDQVSLQHLLGSLKSFTDVSGEKVIFWKKKKKHTNTICPIHDRNIMTALVKRSKSRAPAWYSTLPAMALGWFLARSRVVQTAFSIYSELPPLQLQMLLQESWHFSRMFFIFVWGFGRCNSRLFCLLWWLVVLESIKNLLAKHRLKRIWAKTW